MFAPIKKIPDWNYYFYCLLGSFLAYIFFLTDSNVKSTFDLLEIIVEATAFNMAFLLLALIKLLCKLFKYNLKLKIISTVWICFIAISVIGTFLK